MIVHDASSNGNIAAEGLAHTFARACVSDVPVMRLEILNTFITAVADEDDEDLAEECAASCRLRRHSAPPAFQYTDRTPLHAETKPARSRQKKMAAKAQNATLAAAAGAADEAVLWRCLRKLKRNGACKEGIQRRSAPR